MALDSYLRDQAIRMRRDKWANPWILADEIYLILRGIQIEETGPITIATPGDDVGTPDQPSVDDLNIPPFDLDLPGDGINQPEVEADPTYTKETQTFMHRSIFPGQVQGQTEGAAYSVEVKFNGNLVTSRDSGLLGSNTPRSGLVTATLTDASLAGTVSDNSWVDVYYFAEYQVTEEIFRDDQGRELNRQTEIRVLQEEYLFNAPAAGTSGKVALVTGTISGRSGTTPGSGTAVLYDFTPPEPDPISGGTTDPSMAAGTAVTVFSMVTGSIESGDDAFIQVKRIDNAWWVDVEDCGASGAGT